MTTLQKPGHHPELVVDYVRSESTASDVHDASVFPSWMAEATLMGLSENRKQIGGVARVLSPQEAMRMATQTHEGLVAATAQLADAFRLAGSHPQRD